MALLDSLKSLLGLGTRYESVTYVGPTVTEVLGMSAADLYRTQPHLRTVISFRARNIAQLPLPVYQRVSDTDRVRLGSGDDPAAALFAAPNPDMTTYEFLDRLVNDYDLYGVAVWALTPSNETKSGWQLRPIAQEWIHATGGGSAWAPRWIQIIRSGSGERVTLENKPGEVPQFVIFHGYDPGDPAAWSSPVESLKEILAEQIQAWSYRQQVWQRGGRVGAYLTRPANAPVWSDTARTQFARDWKSKWTGKDGPKAGGTPILEDGMELKRIGYSAREDEWSEVAKLSLATVAAVYHTSPTMVGILDNANYANVREFHQMLYTDTLGPFLAMVQQRINTFIVPHIATRPDVYVEFNIAAKLAGSFEEQAAVISASVGAPWMTRNEARARMNLPALPGGDDIVTPLNVLIGGQASPRDSGEQNRNSWPVYGIKGRGPVLALPAKVGESVRVKAEPRDEDAAMAREVLARFFKRQRAVVLSRLGAKASDPDWWDADRWDKELATDLYALAVEVTQQIGTDTLRVLGVDPDLYSVARTTEFLGAVARKRAQWINTTTLAQIEAALADDLGDDAGKSTPAGVFDEAEGSRAEQAGLTLATTLTAFAVAEAAHQMDRPQTTKTWITTSSNPRASHAAMDGETVPAGDLFSNGMKWPGDATVGDADEVANCQCTVEIEIP